MSAQVAADLRAAADVLERDGWTQGEQGDLTGCKCLVGALAYSVTDGKSINDGFAGFKADWETQQRWYRAKELVVLSLGSQGVLGLIDWNDDPQRTAIEVIAALRTAADKAAES